jgi:hypothetical protein
MIPPTPIDGKRPVERFRDARHHGRCLLAQRPAGEPARLVGVTAAFDRVARERRVGGDDRVDSFPYEHARDAVDCRRREVGRDLDGDRRVLRVLVGEPRLLRFERDQQTREDVLRLQIAQPFGVRRRDVDRHIRRRDRRRRGGKRGSRRPACAFDVSKFFPMLMPTMPFQEARATFATNRSTPVVVEAEAIDQRFGLGDPEQARLRIAGLRARRHRSAFDETEPERCEPIDVRGVLVESRCEADAIRKLESHGGDRRRREMPGESVGRAAARREVETRERHMVRGLGIEREQQRAKHG